MKAGAWYVAVEMGVCVGLALMATAGAALLGWLSNGDPSHVNVSYVFGFALVTYALDRRPR